MVSDRRQSGRQLAALHRGRRHHRAGLHRHARRSIAVAWDFPASPSEGATYTPAGGPTYTFTSGVWRLMPPASSALSTANVSDTPPANPVQGQIWWKSDTGETFIWYDDASADIGQWVQESDASLPDAPTDGAAYGRKSGVWTGVIDKTGDSFTGALTSASGRIDVALPAGSVSGTYAIIGKGTASGSGVIGFSTNTAIYGILGSGSNSFIGAGTFSNTGTGTFTGGLTIGGQLSISS